MATKVDASLVTVGQPTEGGCAYICFGEAAKLPTDATTDISTLTDFESLGYISENGITESMSLTVNKHGEWGGKTILTTISKQEGAVKAEFEEINRGTVAKIRYGKDNVTVGTDGSVKSIKEGALPYQEYALVLDELECNGSLRRTVYPRIAIESFDDIAHQKGSLMVYGMTFTKLFDNEGNSAYVYRGTVSTS